ncbi:MAG: haloacid dehalogenase type II [Streptosporangiaceae bacterium]|nr:haloacid dehalogenase type II [Streptosporangiaceae bacterium]MBV9854692.1 haloacid dehalogenase type II [Streptosporangiaceae bacterium]
MTSRPAAVAFDVIDTLMTLEPLRGRLTGIGQPPHLLEAWYARTIRDGMALSVAGDYAEFHDVAATTLRDLTAGQVSDEQVAYVLAGMAELPPFPDAVPAAERLAAGGVRLACLTNGAPKPTAAFVERAGLAPFIERVISVSEVRRWKPAAIVYRYAAEVLGVPPERLALVAAHHWDCHGAKRAGLTAAWVSREKRDYPHLFAEPDVTGADLVAAAGALLNLGNSPG